MKAFAKFSLTAPRFVKKIGMQMQKMYLLGHTAANFSSCGVGKTSR
jgi:hypothetical protein